MLDTTELRAGRPLPRCLSKRPMMEGGGMVNLPCIFCRIWSAISCFFAPSIWMTPPPWEFLFEDFLERPFFFKQSKAYISWMGKILLFNMGTKLLAHCNKAQSVSGYILPCSLKDLFVWPSCKDQNSSHKAKQVVRLINSILYQVYICALTITSFWQSIKSATTVLDLSSKCIFSL